MYTGVSQTLSIGVKAWLENYQFTTSVQQEFTLEMVELPPQCLPETILFIQEPPLIAEASYDVSSNSGMSFPLPELTITPVGCFQFVGFNIYDKRTRDFPAYMTLDGSTLTIFTTDSGLVDVTPRSLVIDALVQDINDDTAEMFESQLRAIEITFFDSTAE